MYEVHGRSPEAFPGSHQDEWVRERFGDHDTGQGPSGRDWWIPATTEAEAKQFAAEMQAHGIFAKIKAKTAIH